MPRDRFHDYLDVCENVLVSPGDYLEHRRVYGSDDFTKLVVDLLDTHQAGLLKKVTLPNGGVAYTRNKETYKNGNVRQGQGIRTRR